MEQSRATSTHQQLNSQVNSVDGTTVTTDNVTQKTTRLENPSGGPKHNDEVNKNFYMVHINKNKLPMQRRKHCGSTF